MTTKKSFESSPQDGQTNESEGIISRSFTPGRPFSIEDEERLKALSEMPDEDINYSDIPPLPDDFFKTAVRGWLPLDSHTLTLELDAEVYIWLTREGTRNSRLINHVFRREMQQSTAANEQTASRLVEPSPIRKAS